jgi:periplasmic divalent cation tolerance protein
MSNETVVVLVTAPNMETATQIGRALVEERLAACANLIPQVRSIYRWQGEIFDEAEILLLIKTTVAVQEHLTERVLQLHPYETPEVIALPIVAGSDAYLQWIASEVSASAP